MYMQYGPGSTGNVIAAVCSFVLPGLGQLVQARPIKAALMMVLGLMFWFFWLGWIVHIWATLDAAWYQPKVLQYTILSGKKARNEQNFSNYSGQDDSTI